MKIRITSYNVCYTKLLRFFSITKKGKKTANYILAGILILFALQIIFSFTVSNYAFMYFMNWHKSLFLIRQTGLLIGPLIFLYMKTYLTNRPLRITDLFHTIPFAGVFVFLVFYYLKTDVITSYSIHYTKLYDPWESGKPYQPED